MSAVLKGRDIRDAVPITYNGKFIAYVFDDGVMLKPTKRAKHLFRRLIAYGIQASLVDTIDALGVSIVVVYEQDTGDAFVADWSMWRKQSNRNYGAGWQKFLPLREMERLEDVGDVLGLA